MPEIASSSDDAPCPKCNDFLFPFPEDPELAREILRRVDPDSRCHGCDLLQHLPAESRSLTSPNSNEIPCSVCLDLLLPEALRFRHTYKEVRKSAELCVSCDLLQKLAEHLEPDESIREEAVFTLKVELEEQSSGQRKLFINLANESGIDGKCLEVYSRGRRASTPRMTLPWLMELA
jgi:hypothetical protein